MEELADMSRSALEEHLQNLKEQLEEVRKERHFVLSQTGRHISSKKVREYEAEMSALKGQIAQAEEALAAAKDGSHVN